jgi:hypothetical protein
VSSSISSLLSPKGKGPLVEANGNYVSRELIIVAAQYVGPVVLKYVIDYFAAYAQIAIDAAAQIVRANAAVGHQIDANAAADLSRLRAELAVKDD